MSIIYKGFIADVVRPEDYVLGGNKLPLPPLVADGNWMPFLPPGEQQKERGYDTYNCTGFNTLSAIEILFRRIWNDERDFSERFLGVMAGTRPPGNSPNVVCDAIRQHGLIDDALLPFKDAATVEKYYSPDPMPYGLANEGLGFKDVYNVRHEWVFTSGTWQEKKRKIIEALPLSPVCLSVAAWYEKDGLYYRPEGERDGHWTCAVKAEGDFFWAFDSYPPFLKKVDWKMDGMQAKRFEVSKRAPPTKWRSWFSRYLRSIGL